MNSPMELKLFRSLWTTGGDVGLAVEDCSRGLFHGIEGPVPVDTAARREFLAKIDGRMLIAEITSGGEYVPDAGLSPEAHLEDFKRKADAAAEARPLFISSMAGSDAWSLAESVEFFGQAMEVARAVGVDVAFETHRSRSTFHPWFTRDILRALPGMRLTCDFSHWCCVCERLVLDQELEILELCVSRARHVHARVGHTQGAQVPHPAAPEYAGALAAHERWWEMIWRRLAGSGAAVTTMTPESGPDGYLQTVPFTNMPVASLDQINRWMAVRQAARFKAIFDAKFVG
jgi:sugar phosphate isomerase/epimerase